MNELEGFIETPGFKHKDFWKGATCELRLASAQHRLTLVCLVFEAAGGEVAKISAEEARAALEGYDD